MSPLESYQRLLTGPDFSSDPGQRQVVELLDRLYHDLMVGSQPRRIGSALRAMLMRRRQPDRITGLYIWGGVGRGKTLLMDLFHECLPERDRLRMHFHRFMQRVHHDLTELSGTVNPLERVAARLAADARVLCFDEFFVADIGDAMILGELLAALFERGVTLVATSNVEPDALYENGLQRRRFLPAIDLLKRHTLVHHLGGALDYRLRVLERAEIYHQPLDAGAEESLRRSFDALAPERARSDVALEIEGRVIRARQVADDVAWFDFAELCEGPRSQNDYIELSRIFHAVIISGVPRFTTGNEDAARRFISLVDEFYDHGVKLVVSADAEPPGLYGGERLRFEFQRTVSRLLEMQSYDYLARSHRA